jgi:murein DD-endopeptidase MepM/ murein hydrolase activator NlpD
LKKSSFARRAWFHVPLLVIVCAAPLRAETPDRIAQQRSKIAALHARIHQKRDQFAFETVREADLKRQLAETTTAIAGVQNRIDAVQARIDGAQVVEAQEQQRLADAVVNLRRQRDAYRHRIVQMYESTPVDSMAVLVGTRSAADFTERWDDLGFVAEADQHAIAARDAAEHAVEQLERAAEATLIELQTERDERTQSRNQLDALAEERGYLVAVTAANRTQIAAEVNELEEITATEEAQLETLIREQEAQAERERERAGVPAQTAPAPGAMVWPLSGPITSPFGMRLNPFGGGNTEFHPGIDIGVAVGTAVAAAAAGRVIIAGWVSGYGNYIAIDHGDGISTGYGHLSSFYVAVGQEVQRGQAIGASGNTGRSTGPHLIFEVRRNGTPVDPNPFLGGR